jgi:hypothetical protein
MFPILLGLSACGGGGLIDQSCDEPQRYQSVVAGKRIEVPEGLDPLDEYAEMPIPKPEGAPVRPPGSRCVELPPSARTGS